MKHQLNFLIICALFLASCKKEKTSWDSNWSAPLAHGTLTLDDIIPPDYQTTNSDNYISIVYSESVYSFDLDTLIDLPDTSIVTKTALSFGLTINPGFTWGGPADQSFTAGDIELREVRAKQGTVLFNISSEWGGNTTMNMYFPKITLNGAPFDQSYDLGPGSVSMPSTLSDAVDMAGYTMNLTGSTGLEINTLSGDFIVESNEAVNSFPVTIYDTIVSTVSFTDVEIDYAKGYFGSHTLSDTIGIELPFMDQVIAGMIDIDSIKLDLSVWNGFNLAARAKIGLLRGINSRTANQVDLNFPLLNSTLNINPATGGLYDWGYSSYLIPINNTNSNIAPFIENLSDSLMIGYEIAVNPFGNQSAGTDELFPGSSIELMLDAEFPLNIGASNLTLTDTFDISYTGNEAYTGNNADISLTYENGFPLGATLTLYLLNEQGVLMDSIIGNSGINSGNYNLGSYTTTPTSGTVDFNLTDLNILNLESASKMALLVSFTTDQGQMVKIDAGAYFDFAVKSNLDIRLNL